MPWCGGSNHVSRLMVKRWETVTELTGKIGKVTNYNWFYDNRTSTPKLGTSSVMKQPCYLNLSARKALRNSKKKSTSLLHCVVPFNRKDILLFWGHWTQNAFSETAFLIWDLKYPGRGVRSKCSCGVRLVQLEIVFEILVIGGGFILILYRMFEAYVVVVFCKNKRQISPDYLNTLVNI